MEVPGAFVFRHALFQEALYGELLAEQRCTLHERIARVLEALPPSDDVTEQLAYHWFAASDTERAARYNEAAGDIAAHRLAFRDAAALYERALASIASHDGSEAILHEKLARVLAASTPGVRGREAFERAIAFYEACGDQEKVAWLERVDRETRRIDPRIVQVMASIATVQEVVLIATSEGHLGADIRPLVRFNVSVIVEQNGRREQGYAGAGGRFCLADLVAADRPLALGREAARQALVNLEALPAPAGSMTVVLGPGWPGVLLHEAIGHGLEGDFNRKGTSAFANRIGERVANPGCTVVDDGTLSRRRGSLNIDDEGTATQCTTLIEDGILCGYLHDKMNARLMGARSTGNGRRESFAHMTLPRMTNTYMRPGAYAPEEILRSVERGIYAVNFGGGQVDITSGKFVFSASEAYAIENGRLGAPLKGATLIGNGPDVLMRVTMVGNDLKLDDGVGTCGKEGQSVPVGVGIPTIKIDRMTVGGTA